MVKRKGGQMELIRTALLKRLFNSKIFLVTLFILFVFSVFNCSAQITQIHKLSLQKKIIILSEKNSKLLKVLKSRNLQELKLLDKIIEKKKKHPENQQIDLENLIQCRKELSRMVDFDAMEMHYFQINDFAKKGTFIEDEGEYENWEKQLKNEEFLIKFQIDLQKKRYRELALIDKSIK